MSDFDLSAFLAAQKADGVSQGEGGFTISPEKAAEKMVQYSLPREHAWVLKLVQAAVAWNCTAIRLTQTRTESTFTFFTDDPKVLPTNQELVTAILRADPKSQAPLDNFTSALRILVERACLSFLLFIDRTEDEPHSIYAGVYFGDMDEQQRARQRQDWTGSLNLRINHIPHTDNNRILLHYIPVQHHALPMALELERYAYVSPIPILLDGRRVDGVLRSSALKWSQRMKPIRLFPLEVPGPILPSLAICDGFTACTLSVHAESSLWQKDLALDRDFPIYVLLRLRASYEQKISDSFIHWIRQGVIVDSVRLSSATWSLGLHVYVSAEGLPSDLTSFSLIRNDDYLERRDVVYKNVLGALYLPESSASEVFAPSEATQEALLAGHLAPPPLRRFAKTLASGARIAVGLMRSDFYIWSQEHDLPLYLQDLVTIRRELAHDPDS